MLAESTCRERSFLSAACSLRHDFMQLYSCPGLMPGDLVVHATSNVKPLLDQLRLWCIFCPGLVWLCTQVPAQHPCAKPPCLCAISKCLLTAVLIKTRRHVCCRREAVAQRRWAPQAAHSPLAAVAATFLPAPLNRASTTRRALRPLLYA